MPAPPAKPSCAAHMRQRRGTDPAQHKLAAASCSRFISPNCPTGTRPSHCVYLASDGEMDTGHLSAAAAMQGKQLFLPVIKRRQRAGIRRLADQRHTAANRYGIPEPGADAERCVRRTLDIIVLPLVAWDLQGGRLGMGGGFYDRTLAECRARFWWAGHTMQQVPAFPGTLGCSHGFRGD